MFINLVILDNDGNEIVPEQRAQIELNRELTYYSQANTSGLPTYTVKLPLTAVGASIPEVTSSVFINKDCGIPFFVGIWQLTNTPVIDPDNSTIEFTIQINYYLNQPSSL